MPTPTDLIALADKFPASAPELPCFHSSTLEYYAPILKRKRLRPFRCTATEPALVYLFYGHPAYVRKPVIAGLPKFRPFCIVLQPGWETQPYEAYPFDTGAYLAGLYQPHLGGEPALAAFRLEDLPGQVQRVVSAFFDNNSGYVRGNGRRPRGCPKSLTGLTALFTGTDTPLQCDIRSRTIEVRTLAPVLLTRAVLALILPRSLVRDSRKMKILHDVTAGRPIEVVFYDDETPFNPTVDAGAVRQLAMDFLRRRGYLRD